MYFFNNICHGLPECLLNIVNSSTLAVQYAAHVCQHAVQRTLSELKAGILAVLLCRNLRWFTSGTVKDLFWYNRHTALQETQWDVSHRRLHQVCAAANFAADPASGTLAVCIYVHRAALD